MYRCPVEVHAAGQANSEGAMMYRELAVVSKIMFGQFDVSELSFDNQAVSQATCGS